MGAAASVFFVAVESAVTLASVDLFPQLASIVRLKAHAMMNSFFIILIIKVVNVKHFLHTKVVDNRFSRNFVKMI